MNRVFYLFRHGETDWNLDKRCQGHTDIPLNQKGVEQAQLLAEKIKRLNLEMIYSSDLKRAKRTGEFVAQALNTKIVFDSRLREMSYGEAEGLIFQDAVKKFGDETWKKLMSFRKDFDEVSFPGGETRKKSRERFLEVLIEIINETNFQTIGISTHGGAIRNVIHHFLDEDHPMIPIPNCVVYKLEYNSNTNIFEASSNYILALDD